MMKKIIIFLVLISSMEFFQLAILSSRIIYLIQFVITVLMFAVIVVQEIYRKDEIIKHNFKHPIFLIFVGVFLSMITAHAYHGQSFGLTIWAQRFMYYYFFYFFLHLIKPDIKVLERIILAFGIIYTISYLVQFAVYPSMIFDVRQDYSRGTIRIFLPGASFLTLALFLCIQRFYMHNKLRDIFFVLLFFAILVLMGTRNFLASVMLVIIFSLIYSKTIRSRIVIYLIIVISIVPVYFLFQEIFMGLIELSERESRGFENNIRIRAATFFLTDFFPNKLAYFFGNGEAHGRSIYGVRVIAYMEGYRFFLSDIGIIGDFAKFGLFYVIGYLWLLFKVFKKRLKPEYAYIKYFVLLNFFTMPFGSASASGISAFCLLIYIIDKKIDQLKEESLNQKNNPSDQSQDQAIVLKGLIS